MTCRLLIAMVVFMLSFPLRGETDEPPPVTDPVIAKQHYQQVLNQPQFRENEETVADLGFRDWLSRWITQLVRRFQAFKYAGQMSGLAWFFLVTITLLAVAGLVYLLTKLSRRHRDEDALGEMGLVGEPLLSPRAYDEKIQKALATRNWQGAWMAAWLQFLARMEHRQLVEADRSQTNREYLAQLRERQLPASALPLLAALVDDYDRFIYGVSTIDEPLWQIFRQRLDELTLLLHLQDSSTATTLRQEPA